MFKNFLNNFLDELQTTLADNNNADSDIDVYLRGSGSNYDDAYEYNSEVVSSNKFRWQDAGNADKLVGNVLLYKIWAGSPQWNNTDRQRFNQSFRSGLPWINRQAARHGKTVNFIEEDAVFHGNIANGLDNNYESEDRLIEILSHVSGRTLAGMTSYAKSLGCDSWAPIFFCNHKGVSYAQYDKRSHVTLEYAVINRIMRGSGSKEETTAGMVHEIMHVFGAFDLYQNYETTAEQAALMRKMFPRDLMDRSIDDISRYDIGDYTAYMVGWHNNWNDQWNALLPLWYFEETLVNEIRPANRRPKNIEVVMNNNTNKQITFCLLYALDTGDGPKLFKQGWWSVAARGSTTVNLNGVVTQILDGIGYYITSANEKWDASGCSNGSAGIYPITNNAFNDHVARTYQGQYAANFAWAKSSGNSFIIGIS